MVPLRPEQMFTLGIVTFRFAMITESPADRHLLPLGVLGLVADAESHFWCPMTLPRENPCRTRSRASACEACLPSGELAARTASRERVQGELDRRRRVRVLDTAIREEA